MVEDLLTTSKHLQWREHWRQEYLDLQEKYFTPHLSHLENGAN